MMPIILVVDDDRDFRLISSDILNRAGYETVQAANAVDAMLRIEREPGIALLFTEVVMPGINGFMLADMAVTRWPSLRVVYTSEPGDIHIMGDQAGCRHGEMLARPCEPAALASAIAAALANPLLSGDRAWMLRKTGSALGAVRTSPGRGCLSDRARAKLATLIADAGVLRSGNRETRRDSDGAANVGDDPAARAGPWTGCSLCREMALAKLIELDGSDKLLCADHLPAWAMGRLRENEMAGPLAASARVQSAVIF